MKPLDRPAANGERGFTLVELVVAIALLSILGSIVAAATVMTTRATRQDQNRSHAGDDLQKGIERISRELRVADPLWVIEPNDVVVDVRRGGGDKCLRIEWKLSGTTVQRYTQPFDTGCPNNADRPKASPISFLRDNANDGATPLFTYSDHNGQPATSPARVATVSVVLVQALPENRTVRVETVVNLRNAS